MNKTKAAFSPRHRRSESVRPLAPALDFSPGDPVAAAIVDGNPWVAAWDNAEATVLPAPRRRLGFLMVAIGCLIALALAGYFLFAPH